MKTNIDQALARGERIEALEDKSEDLQFQSRAFMKESKKFSSGFGSFFSGIFSSRKKMSKKTSSDDKTPSPSLYSDVLAAIKEPRSGMNLAQTTYPASWNEPSKAEFTGSTDFREFNEATIGAAFGSLPIKVGNSVKKLQIWDTTGQERFLFFFLNEKPKNKYICFNLGFIL